MLVIRNF